MFTKKAKGLALAIGATALVGAAVTSGGSASADPKQYDAPFVLVGSDTTQDVMNAFAGFENGINYTPLQSDSATGQKQIVSWDATANGLTTTCITTRTGGPSFNRPNGSGAGRTALLAAFTAGATTSVSNCGTGTTSPSGQISGARSSSLSSTAGTTLAYVPFARDALSFGFYRKAGSPVTALSVAQLQQIFTTQAGVDIDPDGAGPLAAVKIFGCDIQSGSGTGQTWRTRMQGTATPQFTATTVCDDYIPVGGGTPFASPAPGDSQETDGDGLVLRGDAVDAQYPGAQVIIGMSVGNYIGKANGVARGGMPTTVGIGTITDIATGVSPILDNTVPATPTDSTGQTGRPNLVGNSTFYASSYGRDLYNVFPASVINSAFGNDALKQIFKDTDATAANNALICQPAAATTIRAFGFTTLTTCGDSTSTLRGA